MVLQVSTLWEVPQEQLTVLMADFDQGEVRKDLAWTPVGSAW